MAMSQIISLIIGFVLCTLFPQVNFIWVLVPVLYVVVGVSLVYKNIAKINDSRINN
jgi:hypothetical protein